MNKTLFILVTIITMFTNSCITDVIGGTTCYKDAYQKPGYPIQDIANIHGIIIMDKVVPGNPALQIGSIMSRNTVRITQYLHAGNVINYLDPNKFITVNLNNHDGGMTSQCYDLLDRYQRYSN